MKFRCERDVLADALATVGRAAAQRASSGFPTSAVRMEVQGGRLTLAATDLELTIQGAVEVADAEDGVCLVAARLAADVVRALGPGAVSVTEAGSEVEVLGGRSRFALRSLAVADFPTLPPPAVQHQAAVAAADLLEAVGQVARAASSDVARPLFCGVLFAREADGWRLVATDSYRLAWRDLPASLDFPADAENAIVPARALTELGRLRRGGEGATVGLSVSSTDVAFQVDGIHLVSRLIDGKFPDYKALVPSDVATTVVAQKAALVDALRRMGVLIQEPTTPVRFAATGTGIDLSVGPSEVGCATETVDAQVVGPEVQTAFNASYLIDGIESVAGDDIAIGVASPTRPATLTAPNRSDHCYLLMPVRVA